MSAANLLPTLYVEGADDVSVISALLFRHGIDTARGTRHLFVKGLQNVDQLLANMPDAVRASTGHPVGFVIDIDIAISNRWDAVCGRLRELNIAAPSHCPREGYLGHLPGYPHSFGVWLMPDCSTDGLKLEHLIASLLPEGEPLWSHAVASVAQAAKLVDKENALLAKEDERWDRFRDVDKIKAEVHTWLAWQSCPGAPLGAAITNQTLRHDSPEALAFLRWVKSLYGFVDLNVDGLPTS